MSSSGFITLHRKLSQWEWYTAPNHMFLFTHLLLTANYKDGSWRGNKYKRGDVLTSLDHLAKETGLSVRNVRTILKNLEKTGEVTRKPTRQLTHLTISKYDTYQSKVTQSDTPTDTEVTRSRHGSDNKQQVNNINKENKRKMFTPPTLQEAEDHKKAKNLFSLDCQYFINHYEGNGWMVGKNKMKSWTATMSNWHSRHLKDNPTTKANDVNPF